MTSKCYIYLILSADSPNRARLLRAPLPPIDVVEDYEAVNPGWYVKRVWSVRSAADVAPVMASVIAAYPNRGFEPDDWPETSRLADTG